MAKETTKNILLFTDTPLFGGAELQMYLLAKFLDRTHFNPIVCLGPYETLDKLAKNLENEGIKTIRLPIKHKNDTAQLRLLKKIIKEEKIDLLHVHLWNPASGRFALLAGKRTKTPTITTEHDPFALNPIKNIFKKSTLKNVDKIIAISNANKLFLEKIYPAQKHKIKVVLNGIDTTWWKSQILSFWAKERETIRKDIFKADGATLVGLTVAELHPRKGVHILIQAIQDLIKTLPKKKAELLHFAIAGDGPQRKILDHFIQKQNLTSSITLLGRQKNIPHLMKSADFFILPSIREAFGLVNLEAMVSGLPIIATKTGGIPEILTDKKTALLVPPANEKLLTEAIHKLTSSKALRTKLSKAGKSIVESKFDAKIMAKKYEKIYENVLKDRA